MGAGFWERLLARAGGKTGGKETALQSPSCPQERGLVRRHYWISGRVQAVGFRYTAFVLARENGLTGWVANREDGRVEMELQGRPERMDELLAEIGREGRIQIRQVQMEERPLRAEEGFRIRN